MDELLDERLAHRGRPSSRGCECEAPKHDRHPRDTANPCVVLAGLTCLMALTDEPELASRACPFLGRRGVKTGDRRIIRASAVPPDRPARAASD